MHMLHKNYSLCVNITPAYDRISKIRAQCGMQHELKFHICEAQLVRMRCVSLKCFIACNRSEQADQPSIKPAVQASRHYVLHDVLF